MQDGVRPYTGIEVITWEMIESHDYVKNSFRFFPADPRADACLSLQPLYVLAQRDIPTVLVHRNFRYARGQKQGRFSVFVSRSKGVTD